MRILFVLPDLPHPPFTGAHTRPLTLLRAAARAHEVAVVGAAPADADLSLLRELCEEVRVAPAGAARPAPRRGLAAGRRLVTPVPLVSAGRSHAISDLVDEMATSWKPDAMAVETLYAAHYRVPDVPLIVDLPDVPSGLCESAAAARPVRYLAANLQAATSRRYERRLLDGTVPITINDGDRERLATLGVEAYTVPLSIDLPPEDAVYERSSGARHDVAVRLLFIGSFVHPPNRDAAKWLVNRLAPELRTERVPFALVIAGLHAPAWLRKAGGAGVTVISDAPSLEPLYRSADIVLAPLPHGGRHQEQDARGDGLGPAGDRYAAGVHRPSAAGRQGVRRRSARPAARRQPHRRAARRPRAASAPRPRRAAVGVRGALAGARDGARRRSLRRGGRRWRRRRGGGALARAARGDASVEAPPG